MATSTSTDSVADHMTKLRMKMVQQKIQNEKERITRPQSVESKGDDLENQARLQQAMLRRQDLLDKIRREQLLNEENKRPRTYSANRRRYTPSPLPVPPSRRSLPEFPRFSNQNPYYNQMPDTHRSKPEMPQVKHVIEHTIAQPRQQQQQNPYQLPPIQQQQQQAQPPVIIQQPPPPPIVSMQQPGPPAIIQGPAPQHIITGYPNPVIHNLGSSQSDNRGGGMFNKAEMGDLMMMQNAQLHQLVMQKMMLKDMGGAGGLMGSGRTHSSCSSHHHHSPRHGHHHHGCSCAICVPVVPVPRVGQGAVHHHHYTSPPPSQPAVHHYSTLPAMDIRGGYPMRDFASAYTAPGYAYGGYDDGNNYYAYH